MYTDDQFLESLRAEILATQERRFAYVKLKLGFIFAVLGLAGIAAFGAKSVTAAALLAPIIALVFDLYIISEDFSIKRIGAFFAEKVSSSKLAQLWESMLPEHRDPFTPFAAPISTAIAVIPGAYILGFPDEPSELLVVYIVFSVVAVGLTVAYEFLKRHKIKKFMAALSPLQGSKQGEPSEDGSDKDSNNDA